MSEAEQQATEPSADAAVEEQARAKGWVPQDEFKGKNWKPADAWLRDGDEIASLRAQLEETKNAFVEFGRQNREAEREKMRKELEAKLDEAVESGDKAEARKVTAEIKKVDADAEQAEDIPAPAKKFIDRNKEWFGFHERATDFARMTERRLLSNGASVSEAYDKVEEAVKDRFPELFESASKTRASSVDSGGSVRRVGGKKSHGVKISDLPEAYQKIARGFVKRGVMTEEKYIQSLIDDGTVRVES